MQDVPDSSPIVVKSRSRSSRWLRWFLAGAVAAFVLVAFLPTLLMQTPLRGLIVGGALARVGLRAEIGSAHWGWFVPARLEEVDVRTQDHAPLIQARAIRSDRTLWEMLFAGEDLGELDIEQPRIHLIISEDGTNFDFPDRDDDDPSTDEDESGPRRPASLRVRIEDAEVLLKTTTMSEEARLVSNVGLEAELRQTADSTELIISPGPVLQHAEISQQVCDGGLKFVMPILSEVTWVQGDMSIGLSQCRIDLDSPEQSEVAGQIQVHSVQAGLKNPLAREIAQAIAKLIGREVQGGVQLAESAVEFQVRDGRVWHQGLAFGLPELSPELQMLSQGSVGFDESLDLTIDIPLPLKLLGSGPLVQSLGDQTIRLPVGGTLTEPEVKFDGEGMLGSVIAGLGQQLSDGDVTIQDLLQPLRDLRRANGEEERPLLRPRRAPPANEETRRRPLRNLLDRLRDLDTEKRDPDTEEVEP